MNSCGWNRASIFQFSILLIAANSAFAFGPTTFQFESIASIDDMRKAIETDFPLGSPRSSIRKHFVAEGSATQITHPTQAGVEKYIYDINLCSYYIWRWNISADYDTNGHLQQAYVNGEPVFASGNQKKDSQALAKSGKASILKVIRPRPEATKGEKELVYFLLDADGDPKTIDDQVLNGAGPTRADPLNMGTMHIYTNVEPWRSIFDLDNSTRIVAFQGDCRKADDLYSHQKAQSQAVNK
jgi:hypothetical protein